MKVFDRIDWELRKSYRRYDDLGPYKAEIVQLRRQLRICSRRTYDKPAGGYYWNNQFRMKEILERIELLRERTQTLELLPMLMDHAEYAAVKEITNAMEDARMDAIISSHNRAYEELLSRDFLGGEHA